MKTRTKARSCWFCLCSGCALSRGFYLVFPWFSLMFWFVALQLLAFYGGLPQLLFRCKESSFLVIYHFVALAPGLRSEPRSPSRTVDMYFQSLPVCLSYSLRLPPSGTAWLCQKLVRIAWFDVFIIWHSGQISSSFRLSGLSSCNVINRCSSTRQFRRHSFLLARWTLSALNGCSLRGHLHNSWRAIQILPSGSVVVLVASATILASNYQIFALSLVVLETILNSDCFRSRPFRQLGYILKPEAGHVFDHCFS